MLQAASPKDEGLPRASSLRAPEGNASSGYSREYLSLVRSALLKAASNGSAQQATANPALLSLK